MNPPKARVLAVVDYYLPGYKGGGPAVSVSRIINRLAGEFDFYVYTRDRDLGDTQPYPDIPTDEWFENEGVRHFYASPKTLSLMGLRRAIRAANPDIVYLNSYFSKLTRQALLLRMFRLIPKAAFLVAPRGEFSPGALQLKGLKKKLYLKFAAASRLHHSVTWQVSSVHEMQDTQHAIAPAIDYYLKPPDLLDVSPHTPTNSRPEKTAGKALFAFISRISPKKNLLNAIQMLREVQGTVAFTIYGPIEDSVYWTECEEAMASLPSNVTCHYAGPVPPSEVASSLAHHHFFLFPTLGENFGHVIPEALNAGCPVLLSDQTPWLDLEERQAGWVLPLEPASAWQELVQKCVDLDSESYHAMSSGARNYIRSVAESSDDLVQGRRMFVSVMGNCRDKAA